MDIKIPLTLLLVMLLFAAWQGGVINWKFDTKNASRWSNIWHKLGFAVRVGLQLLLLFESLNQKFDVWSVVLFQVIALNIQWTFYDLLINTMRPTGIWHIDDKGINAIVLKIFRKKWLIWSLRIALYEASIITLLIMTTAEPIDMVMGIIFCSFLPVLILKGVNDALIIAGLLQKPNKSK